MVCCMYICVTLFFMSMIVIEIYCLVSGTETRQPENTGAQAHPLPADPAGAHHQPQTSAVDAWTDSVLGGLEDHPPCQHCLMGPCITVSEVTRIQGSCAPDITNHSKRHKNYRQFWKSLKDRGLWQHELYIHRKTSAGLSEVELRELMPQCVLDDTRKRYPNPPGVPYMGHKRT